MQNLSDVEVNLFWAVLGSSLISIAYALFLRRRVLAQDTGTTRMQEIWGFIKTSAAAYLDRQFRAIIPIAIVLAALAGATVLIIPPNPDAQVIFGADQVLLWVAGGRAAALIVGVLFAYMACATGMRIATEGNVRVVAAARKGYAPALQNAYRAGNVTSLLTVGLGLLGSAAIVRVFGIASTDILLSFAFGGSLVVLFLRIGGGIYSQSVAIGSELVSKVELGIAENDLRNATVVADLVGDTAGDGAGTAADLFESAEITFVAALILGLALGAAANAAVDEPGVDVRFILFPLALRGVGILATLIGNMFVRTDERRRNAAAALNRGFYLTAVLVLGGGAALTQFYMRDARTGTIDWRPFLATAVGVVLAIALSRVTEYFTAANHSRVKEVGRFSRTGTTTNLLAGLSLSFASSLWTGIAIVVSLGASVFIFSDADPDMYATAVLYGIALTGIGMLSLSGSFLVMNSFGAIADNANRIGTLAGLDKNARNVMEDMDAIGHTIRGTTRGVVAGITTITAIALLGAFFTNTINVQTFFEQPHLSGINIASPTVLIGLFSGGAILMLFAALTTQATLRTTAQVVTEARRYLKKAGVKEGTTPPAYAHLVRDVTTAMHQELFGIGAIAVLPSIVVGLLLGVEALGAFLTGIILSGLLLAILQSNAGSAWGNTRRYIEDGNVGGKHSEAHKAAIVSALVGDTLKGAVGPALNPLVKTASLLTLVLAPVIVTIRPPDEPISTTVWAALAVCLIVLFWAIRRSRRETESMIELGKAAAAQGRI